MLVLPLILMMDFKILVKSSKNKAAKEKVEQVSKIKSLFKEHLGLEMRRIHGRFLYFP